MVVDVRCDICSFTWVHLTVDARCKLLLFLVPLWPHQVTMKLMIVSNYAYSKISMKHPCLRYGDSDGDDEAICPPYCFKFWFLFLNADLLMVSTTQLNWRTKSTWFLGLLKMVRCLTLKDLESSDHVWHLIFTLYCICYLKLMIKCCPVAGLFVNVAHKVFVATKDGEEILIVELAEFVASLKSANEGAITA